MPKGFLSATETGINSHTKKQILEAALNRIGQLYYDFPVEDQTERQQGFEEGLAAAIRAVQNEGNIGMEAARKPTSFKCPTTKELNRHFAAIQAATLHVGAIPAHPQKRPVNPYPNR